MMAKFLSFKTYSSETLKLRIIDVIFTFVQHMLMKFHIDIGNCDKIQQSLICHFVALIIYLILSCYLKSTQNVTAFSHI